MRFSRKEKKKKEFFDIHENGQDPFFQKIKKEFRMPRVLNLRPTWLKRYPVITAVVVIGLGIVAIIGVRRASTKADVADFYPTNCLGTWANPQNAQGVPENISLGFASSTFNASNSAIFSTSSTQIFCGGFVPSDYSASGTIQSVGLTLVWNVAGADASTSTDDLPVIGTTTVATTTATTATTTTATTTPTTTTPTTTETDAGVGAGDTSTDDLAPAPTSTPASSTSFLDRWGGLLGEAFAQSDPAADTTTIPTDDASITTSTPTDTATTDTTTDTTGTVIIGPPLEAVLVPVGTSTTDTIVSDDASSTLNASTSDASTTDASSSSAFVPAPPAPDENFLSVSYSLDGQTWIELQKVSLDNWRDFTISIPVLDWSDLKNLQVRVQDIPTTLGTLPGVLLDGELLEVHYDGAATPENPIYPRFALDQASYTASDTITIANAPPESFIEIYALDNDPANPGIPENDYGTQIDNAGGTTIDTHTLPPGRYILVNTFEPGACNEYSIDQCRERDDYISEIQITVTPD